MGLSTDASRIIQMEYEKAEVRYNDDPSDDYSAGYCDGLEYAMAALATQEM